MTTLTHRDHAWRRCILAGLSTVLISTTAEAATYSYTFTTGASTINALARTASFPIYLHETSSDGSSQINTDGGLFSFGLTALVVSGPGQFSGLTGSSAFDQLDGGTSTFPVTTATLWAEQNTNFPNGPTADSAGDVPVATLTLTGLTASTTFTLADYDSGFQTVDYAGVALDPTTVTQTVAAVPEPATLTIALAGLTIASIRRRAASSS